MWRQQYCIGFILNGLPPRGVFSFICNKVAQKLGKAQAAEPLTQGINKPDSKLPHRCREDDIMNIDVMNCVVNK